MAHSARTHEQAWIDDYLDLYNYARHIGDTEWQAHILRMLQQKDNHIEDENAHLFQLQLWRKFDSVNRKLLELIGRIRSVSNETELFRLQRQIGELKAQRNELARTIKQTSA